MQNSTASNRLIHTILQVARHHRQDIDRLLSGAGLECDSAPRAGGRIPATALDALFEQLALSTGNSRIALRAAEATQPRTLGSVGFLLATANNLGQAFQSLADYLPLLIEGVELTVERDAGEVRLQLDTGAGRYLREWLLACLYGWSRQLTGIQIPAIRVDFRFDGPAAEPYYRQFFAAEVAFGARADRLILPRRYLEQPCVDANPEMYRLHQQLADEHLDATGLEAALVARVKGMIRQRLEEGRADLGREEVAAQLNLSLRTLQRKLDRQDTSFQALFDQTRQDMAIQLLQRDIQSIGEVSYRLGFSGLSAFQKAFRRWTGSTPSAFRQAQGTPREASPSQPIADHIPPNGLPESQFYPLAAQLLESLAPKLAGPPDSLVIAPERLHLLSRNGDRWQLNWQDRVTLAPLAALPYQAPESGVRASPLQDVRALLYGVGGLLYWLLHGRPPHPDHDLRPLLRSSQSVIPNCRDDLSPPLRRLLERMLAPSPRLRYASLPALQAALSHCQDCFTDAEARPDEAQAPDMSLDSLALPDKSHAALDGLVRQLDTNQGHLLLVSGPPGSGKSALLDCACNRLRPAGARVLALRFPSRPHPDQPAAPTRLLRQLIHQEWADDGAEFERWSRRLLRQPGENLRQLQALLPETAELLATRTGGPAGHLADLHPGALLGTLLRLSLKDRPVLICLDDLQFADSTTLAMLNMLTSLMEDSPLLIIGTWHRDETSESSPFSRQLPLLNELARSTTLHLDCLDHNEVRALLDRLLDCSDHERRILTDRLLQSSRGNRRRIEEQLQQLQSRYDWQQDPASGRWHWPSKATRDAAVSDDADLHLLQSRHRLLPTETAELLVWAATLGPEFDTRLLARVCDKPPEQIDALLRPARDSKLIRRRARTEIDGHDRFASAGFARQLCTSLPPDALAARRRRIGAVLQCPQKDACDDDLLQALEQLHQAEALVPDPSSRTALARLGLAVANRARDAGALTLACDQLVRCRSVLQPPLAPELALLAFELDLALAQLHSAGGETATADRLFATLHRTPLPPASLSRLGLACSRHWQRQERYDEAQRQLHESLALLGVAVPESALAQLEQARLVTQRPMPAAATADEAQAQALPLLRQLWLLAEQRGDTALALCTLAQIAALGGGSDAFRALGHAGYALLRGWLGADDLALRSYAEQARRPDAPAPCASTLFILGARIEPWTTGPARSLETLTAAQRLARETGDSDTADLAHLVEINSRWMLGEPLDTLAESVQDQLQRLRRTHNPAVEQSLRASALRLLQALGTLSPFKAPDTEPVRAGADTPWALVTDCVTGYLLRQREDWPRLLRRLGAAENHLGGYAALAELTLFTALIRAELCQGASGREREALLRTLRHDETQLELWSRRNPPGLRHRHELLLAEREALSGQPTRAMDAWEGAIRNAETVGDLHLQALAYEQYGRFWFRQGRISVARALLLEARRLYDVWRAPAKVAQLQDEFFSEPVIGAAQE